MRFATRRFLFISYLLVSTALAGTLSFYKIAIANAYRVMSELPPSAPAVTSSQAAAARGRYLLQVMGCRDCHGPALLGQQLLSEEDGVVLSAPSLRVAAGEQPPSFERLWQRLRFGVDDERRALWGMPRRALLGLKDLDVAALVAAVRSLPPVREGEVRPALPQSHLVARGYLAVAWRRLWLSERDDPRRFAGSWGGPAPVDVGGGDGTASAYLARAAHCTSCHAPANAERTSVVWESKAGPSLERMLRNPEDVAAWQAAWQQSGCLTNGDGLAEAEPAPIHRARLFTAAEQAGLRHALQPRHHPERR